MRYCVADTANSNNTDITEAMAHVKKSFHVELSVIRLKLRSVLGTYIL